MNHDTKYVVPHEARQLPGLSADDTFGFLQACYWIGRYTRDETRGQGLPSMGALLQSTDGISKIFGKQDADRDRLAYNLATSAALKPQAYDSRERELIADHRLRFLLKVLSQAESYLHNPRVTFKSNTPPNSLMGGEIGGDGIRPWVR